MRHAIGVSLEGMGLKALVELVESAVEGIAVLTTDGGRFRHVNRAGCRILGRELDELRRVPATEFPLPGAGQKPNVVTTVPFADLELECVLTVVRTPPGPVRVIRFRDVTDARRQERRLKAFSRTSASVAFAESLTKGLDRLAADVHHASGMEACTFLLMDDDGDLRQVGTSGAYPGTDDYGDRIKACRALGAPLLSEAAFESGRLQVIEGWREITLADHRFAPVHEINLDAAWDTIAVLPLAVRGSIVGVFNGFYLKGRRPSDSDLAFLSAIADQAAVAVDNARMLVELEEKTALDERHRLARELHDSVSQALFSMTLQVRALELLAQQGPPALPAVTAGLGEIRELTRGALAEMRALIFQLRPEALHEEGLVSAIRRQAAAIEARENIRVVVDSPDQPLALAPDTETELFRVVNEAMTNVVKHASARRLDIRLMCQGERRENLVIEVVDDGHGFDPQAPHSGHLGLVSMSERVARLGGAFRVFSRPGRQTTVHAVVPGVIEHRDDLVMEGPGRWLNR